MLRLGDDLYKALHMPDGHWSNIKIELREHCLLVTRQGQRMKFEHRLVIRCYNHAAVARHENLKKKKSSLTISIKSLERHRIARN